MPTMKTVIERARVQVDGLKAAPTLDQGAPFPSAKMAELLAAVDALEARQEQLKADLHQATQQLRTQGTALRDAFQRNLAHAHSALGKYDKRLESLGGRALARTPRKRKEAPPPTP